MTKNLEFLKKYKYTHRGLHSEKVSENSLESFKLAIEKNYAIELDIRVTKDGNWIVFHDDNLLRMTGSNVKIKDLLFDELNNYKLINNNEKIPLLSDVLDLVNNKVPLLIEIKHIKKTRKNLKNLFEILDNYKGDFAVFSFSPIIVYLIKKYRKNYIRGQISSFFDNKKIPKFIKYFYKSMFFNRFTKPDFISYNIENIPNKYIKKAKEKGILLFGYTAKSLDEYYYSLKFLDNVVFENFII